MSEKDEKKQLKNEMYEKIATTNVGLMIIYLSPFHIKLFNIYIFNVDIAAMGNKRMRWVL